MLSRDLRVLVVGAGVAGLAVARTLRAIGLRPEVIERRPESTVAVAGTYLPGNGARALRQLGLYQPVRVAGAVIERQCLHDFRGRELCAVELDAVWGEVGECRALPRADLHRVLFSGAGGEVRFETGLEAVELVDGDPAKVRLSDGTSAAYDLVVAADGRRSRTRELAGLGGAARPIGRLAYRFVVDGFPGIVDWIALLGRCTAFVAMPIGGGRVYCQADEARRPLAAVPPDPAARVRHLFGSFGGPVPDLLTAIGTVQTTVLEEVELPRWSRGPLVLVGDAAHATSPNLAQGAAMALEDALVLAESMDQATTLPGALARYEQRRRPRTGWVLAQSRRRDHHRSLPPLLRDTLLRLGGDQIVRGSYRPLREPA